MDTRIIRINGVPVRVPREQLHEHPPFEDNVCGVPEPDWPDGTGGDVVCTLPPHETGPSGLAHMANDAGAFYARIIAIWWDAPARPGNDDAD